MTYKRKELNIYQLEQMTKYSYFIDRESMKFAFIQISKQLLAIVRSMKCL